MSLKGLKKLKNGKAYNYILLFSSGNIKIGLTTDIENRIQQLSNSNSGGYKLENYYISKPNYIANTVEKYMHFLYKNNRVEGEFFENLNFEDVCNTLENIMNSNDFKISNQVRKEFYNKNHCAPGESKILYEC